MDLTELEALLAVARHGRFTAAARALHRSQPGVSRQVQRLEAEVGATLLDRASDPLVPTPAGEAMIRFAEETIANLERLKGELRAMAGQPGGQVRIAASTTPGQFLVPTLIARFSDGTPNVRFEVDVTDSAQVAATVRDGACDVGFTGQRHRNRRLQYRRIGEDEIVLAVPPSHPLGKRGAVALSDLENEPYIEREEGSGTRDTVRAAIDATGRDALPMRPTMVLSNTEAVVSAVEAGHGVGWVSALALEHRDHRRVVGVRIQDLNLVRPLYMVHRRRAALTLAAGAFVDWVTEVTGGAAPPDPASPPRPFRSR